MKARAPHEHRGCACHDISRRLEARDDPGMERFKAMAAAKEQKNTRSYPDAAKVFDTGFKFGEKVKTAPKKKKAVVGPKGVKMNPYGGEGLAKRGLRKKKKKRRY